MMLILILVPIPASVSYRQTNTQHQVESDDKRQKGGWVKCDGTRVEKMKKEAVRATILPPDESK